MRRLNKGRAQLADPVMPQQPSGSEMPHGYRTEIRKIMQSAHFVLPTPDAVPEGLQRAKRILNELKGSDYKLTPDLVEAKSLATVACIILQELV